MRFGLARLLLCYQEAKPSQNLLAVDFHLLRFVVQHIQLPETLLASFNGSISAPSANRSGYISPTTAKHVEDEFGEELLIIDGGACEDGIESTVLSLLDTPTILRPGSVTKKQIEDVIGTVEIEHPAEQDNSPGTSPKHYAPNTSTALCTKQELDTCSDKHSVVLTLLSTPNTQQIKMPTDPEQYATKIYSALREADSMGLLKIYVEIPPSTPEWCAVQDRLMRCAF